MASRSLHGSIVGMWALALVVTALAGGLGRCSVEPDIDVAVARGTGDSPLTIYVSTCGRTGAHVVTLSELIGGSRTQWGVPIYWQIVSRAGSRRAVYRVGHDHAGFVTSVPLLESPPNGRGDFYDVDVDGVSSGGFTFADLQEARALPTNGTCRTKDDARERWVNRLIAGLLGGVAFFILVWIGLGVASRFLPGILHPAGRVPRQTVIAGVAVSLAVVGLLTLRGEPHRPGLAIPRGSPDPGPLSPSLHAKQRVLAVFDSTESPGSRVPATQFTARGPYVMYIGCTGTSVQVSEGFETPNVAYGVRTVAFCNPKIRVPSALEGSPTATVTLGVVPNAVHEWRVTIATR